jgi:hypothetical protein
MDQMNYRAYVGLDVHKATIAIAIAEVGRNSEVRFFGESPTVPTPCGDAQEVGHPARQIALHLRG